MSNLPVPVTERGITAAQWSTLKNSLFPGAQDDSILMAIDYCKARKLDPMKKPCHIVPIYVKDARTGNGSMRDVIMPGIYEYRTTAQRTGQYMGRSRAEFGPVVSCFGASAPEWCEVIVYRWHPASNTKIEFPARVLFSESCGVNKEGKANQRWAKAPVQMLEKCAEAAALRAAFPDELGGEMTADEMYERTIDVTPAPAVIAPPQKAAVQEAESAAAARPDGAATEKQVKLLHAKLDRAGVSAEELCAAFQIDSVTALPFDQVNDALSWISERAA